MSGMQGFGDFDEIMAWMSDRSTSGPISTLPMYNLDIPQAEFTRLATIAQDPTEKSYYERMAAIPDPTISEPEPGVASRRAAGIREARAQQLADRNTKRAAVMAEFSQPKDNGTWFGFAPNGRIISRNRQSTTRTESHSSQVRIGPFTLR